MKCNCSQYEAQLSQFDDILTRSTASGEISSTLTSAARGDWRNVHKCSICGAMWCEEYPFSELHGGGLPCFYRIETDNPTKWLNETEYLTTRIRKEYEDAKFFESLGPEIGPDNCKYSGCERKTIKQSVFCRQHHFENTRNMQQ